MFALGRIRRRQNNLQCRRREAQAEKLAIETGAIVLGIKIHTIVTGNIHTVVTGNHD